MKIDPAAPQRPTPARRAGSAGGARSDAFAKALADSAAPSSIGGGSPIGALNAMLALQEVPDALDSRRRAKRRGEQILDLLVGVLLLVGVFRSSGALASAYGIAVTGTMVVTAMLAFVVIWKVWNWRVLAAAALVLPFLLIDLTFLFANLLKVVDGGWVPLLLGGFLAGQIQRAALPDGPGFIDLVGVPLQAQLAQLAQTIRARREEIDDPRLAEILDEIELRAAVELAKFSRGD